MMMMMMVCVWSPGYLNSLSVLDLSLVSIFHNDARDGTMEPKVSIGRDVHGRTWIKASNVDVESKRSFSCDDGCILGRFGRGSVWLWGGGRDVFPRGFCSERWG